MHDSIIAPAHSDPFKEIEFITIDLCAIPDTLVYLEILNEAKIKIDCNELFLKSSILIVCQYLTELQNATTVL